MFQSLQQIQQLVNYYVESLIKVISKGISGRELSKSCYYEVWLKLYEGQLALSIKSHKAHKELYAMADSTLVFPENVRQAMLQIIFESVDCQQKWQVCSKYSSYLSKRCQ